MPCIIKPTKLRSSTEVVEEGIPKKADNCEFSRKSTCDKIEADRSCSPLPPLHFILPPHSLNNREADPESDNIAHPPPSIVITQCDPELVASSLDDESSGDNDGYGSEELQREKKPRRKLLFEHFNEETQERKKLLSLRTTPPTQADLDLMDRHPSMLHVPSRVYAKSTFANLALQAAGNMEEGTAPSGNGSTQLSASGDA